MKLFRVLLALFILESLDSAGAGYLLRSPETRSILMCRATNMEHVGWLNRRPKVFECYAFMNYGSFRAVILFFSSNPKLYVTLRVVEPTSRLLQNASR